MPVAFVIDGAFFLRRLHWSFPEVNGNDAEEVGQALLWLVRWHLEHRSTYDADRLSSAKVDHPTESADLYRIFFYDCPPLTKKLHKPISRTALDLSKTAAAATRIAIHEELQTLRKLALRLGRLQDASHWRLSAAATKRLIAGDGPALTDDDFEIDTKQKGVDMKLGLDVAAMAFKRQVDQIVLVAADADFVPATKLARREGIDVVLDTMGATPAADLFCHVDGVRDCRKPKVKR